MSFMQNVMMKMAQVDAKKNEDEAMFNSEAEAVAKDTGASIDQAKQYLIDSYLGHSDTPLHIESSEYAKKEQDAIDATKRKQLLKDLGYSGAGAGLGGLGGYYLAKLIDDSATAKAIGTVLGTGLGGSLGYLYGDRAKNKLVHGYNNLMV